MQENTAQTENLVGIEVSKTKMIAVCLGADGGVIDGFKSVVDPAQETLPQLVRLIGETRERYGEFGKLGLAVPGLLERQTNRVTFSTRFPELAGIDLPDELERATGLEICVKNDANAAAYAEHIFGAGRGSKNMFYVTLGAGIGGALIFNERLWEGASGFAGEFGHIAINSEGMKLEDFASSENIVRRTKSWFHKDTTSSLNTIGEERITIADIVREAINEDDFARMMLERTGTYVGTALAGVINLLNIERIVVGGEIMQAGEIVLEAIIERARELSFMPSFRAAGIVAGELGENAGAIGAALLSERES
jgi:glucokinase